MFPIRVNNVKLISLTLKYISIVLQIRKEIHCDCSHNSFVRCYYENISSSKGTEPMSSISMQWAYDSILGNALKIFECLVRKSNITSFLFKHSGD